MPEITAYHECGHALMAVLLGGRVQSVTIEPDNDDGPNRFGDAQIQWPTNRFTNEELVKKYAMVALAGPVAEMIHTGDPFHPGMVPEWASDWQVAWRVTSDLVPDEHLRLRYLEQLSRDLYQTLSRDELWAALAALVDNLLAHETLERDELEDILSAWL